MTAYLLDTNALIWIGTEARLEAGAVQALNIAAQDGTPVTVSPYSAWEIGLLTARNRIRLPSEPATWFKTILKAGKLKLAPLTPDILIASSFLPGTPPNDPADRIIIASARSTDTTIITRDRLILAYAGEGHVRAIAC